MKRALCAWLPDWPLQRLLAARPELRERPIVIHAEAGRAGRCVTACSRFAAEQGIVPGLSLAEARMLLDPAGRNLPAHYEPHDPEADAVALRQLAIDLQRFSPRVGIEEPDALALDIGGCAHLFGDEPLMARQVWQALHRLGCRARVAVADTIGAAWGIARFTGERVTIIAAEQTERVLDALPIEALRLPETTINRLHRLDVRTIGCLRALPRASLPSRFGSEIVSRLDRMFGNVPELLEPIRPAEPLETRQAFEDPLSDRRTLETVLRRMLAELVEQVRPRQEGIQRLVCRLEPEQGEAVELSIGVSRPGDAVANLWELFALRLERTPLPEEIAAVRLRVVATAPLSRHQPELYARDASRDAGLEFDRLLDRLSSRLGSDAVLRPRLVPDAQPEHACRFEPALENDSARQDQPMRSTRLPRPLHLLIEPAAVEVVSVVPDGPPVRLRWRNHSHVVRFAWGPERIAAGWWRSPHVERDYYRVETDDGRRFWLYREETASRWYLHGTFE
ncbi:MAG: DNA polymerase Y family protein [Planctomycetaceae bacterium]